MVATALPAVRRAHEADNEPLQVPVALPQPPAELPEERPLMEAPAPAPARGEDEVSIGPRPKCATVGQWAALRPLHWGLGQPTPPQLVRQLRMWGARQRHPCV